MSQARRARPLPDRRGSGTAARWQPARLPSSARRVAAIVLLALPAGLSLAQGTYQEPERFLAEVFGGEPPEPKAVWLTGDKRDTAADLLGHPPKQLRVRYWRRDSRTAWILEEVGKKRPITTGVVVGSDGIERIDVLIYRESRGHEVRYPFFTKQFKHARLNGDQRLSRDIDGISGATLSVHALKRVARLALYLHDQVGPQLASAD